MKHPSQVDLGLAISGCHCKFGVPKTHGEIAAYCSFNPTTGKWASISRQRVEQIEKRALRKVRIALYRDKQLAEEFKHFLHGK